ncbi:MAG: hypothetical protein UY11_C0011G0008 [Candidatus Amesbacteria bacterium GW2011_GWC2_47_8]|uniref:UVR domain-containing protein n=1 Tax=Candidatus Amesbacteria bacterium GW2011_GWC2_47_8 TaxID=1618367 RepID=A0A0G1WNY8_9BACT|nr:MAG: hypothetical protein UY11_C0011G0008 [Candidatus Amesbacteria bacterium GW2011_GWC2_47_8]
MYWANFLHIYQPSGQQPDILEAVVAQSYRPLIAGILKNPRAKLTLNVTGALLELFDKHGYFDLIDDLKAAGTAGQIEFTGSAKYHTLLPFLSPDDIIHQIKINDETSRFYLGRAYNPRGFFPPEMAYHPKLAPILASLGYSWVIIDEIAFNGQVEKVDYTKTYKVKGTSLRVFFRERRLSNLIMSAAVRNCGSLKEALGSGLHSSRYVITGMDGETFGHHRPGLENLLFEIFIDPAFHLLTISQLSDLYPKPLSVKPLISTWASSEQNIDDKSQFLSWKDPKNAIHELQWKLYNLALNLSKNTDREKMDIASASDHFFWASAKPWWSLEMIEEGAYRLLDVIESVPHVDLTLLVQAKNYYQQIISVAFDWQRHNRVRKLSREQKSLMRIPFKDRTLAVGGEQETVFFAFLDMMKKQEEKAVQNQEYESAIMWRDAIYELQNKLDIYDTVHAVDLLRVTVGNSQMEKVIQQYKAQYHKIRSGQPEQR